MNKMSDGVKQLIWIVVFFIIDILLLMGMFYVCEEWLSIQNTTWKIIISCIVATPISQYVTNKIMKLIK
ncbi:MAG: hypothetical protein IAB93_07505 [Bacteroidetes bacterium]|uniref:Uncharacterized protein n=1 Tax=Candidatus Merdivivens pullistercoris TaxID=2840873 RepID=A0A9D9I4K0_9BACT|nr:hypothetical protein [Candidatus Merdivivens pullistercoris]